MRKPKRFITPAIRPASSFEREVLTQPRALSRVLTVYSRPHQSPLLRSTISNPPSSILFLGIGSSLYAALPAVCHLNRHGVFAEAQDASEYLYYGGQLRCDALPVLISQSGESPEVNKIARQLSRPWIAVTNNPRSTLAKSALVVLPILAAKETGTTNQTYTNTIVVCLALAARIGGTHDFVPKQIPGLMKQLLQNWRAKIEPVADFLGDTAHLDIFARGPSLATALQGALILRELTHIKTSPFSAGQFRHGPLASAKERATAIGIAPRGPTQTLTLRLAADIVNQGGSVVLLTNKKLKTSRNWVIVPTPALDEQDAPLYDILFFELLGILLAERRGMIPGGDVIKITTKE